MYVQIAEIEGDSKSVTEREIEMEMERERERERGTWSAPEREERRDSESVHSGGSHTESY